MKCIQRVMFFAVLCCLCGCSEYLARSVFAAYEDRIGYRSGQKRFIDVEKFRLEALVLNSKPYKNNPAFYICIRVRSASKSEAKNIEIYPAQVFVKLKNGQTIRPSSYFDSGYCPSPNDGSSAIPEFDFHKIDEHSIAVSHRVTEYAFDDFSFKFNIQPIDPDQDFYFTIGEMKVDGVLYQPDPISLTKTYGQREPWQ